MVDWNGGKEWWNRVKGQGHYMTDDPLPVFQVAAELQDNGVFRGRFLL